MTTTQILPGVEILAPISDAHRDILTPKAVEFFAALQREFNPRRLELLAQRKTRQQAIDRGEYPTFLAENERVRWD